MVFNEIKIHVMNIIEQFDHPGKIKDKAHFVHLVQIAMADGTIEQAEFDLLQLLGSKMGLTSNEMHDLLESTKNSAYIPPYKLSKRFGHLYDVMKMVFVDGKIESNEMRLATVIGLRSGFTEQEMPVLLNILIHGIKNNEQEDVLFELFNNRRMVR